VTADPVTQPDPPPADPPPADPALAALNDRVGRIETAVQTLVGKAHGGARRGVEDRLDADSSVAAEVQRELARAEADRQAHETREQTEARLKGAEDTLARLTEKVPEKPVRKIEHRMWGQ
jgi:hypothetical protein